MIPTNPRENGRLPDRRAVLDIAGTLVLVAVVLPFVVLAVPQVVGASQGYVVLSSSMAPAIHAGDAVIVEDVRPSTVERGDVITFVPPRGHPLADEERVTHRVVEVVEREDGRYFRTKGDANEEPDPALVPAENLLGVVSFHLPLVGWVTTFAGTRAGIVTMVLLPAGLLVVSEAWALYRAFRSAGDGSTPSDGEVAFDFGEDREADGSPSSGGDG